MQHCIDIDNRADCLSEHWAAGSPETENEQGSGMPDTAAAVG